MLDTVVGLICLRHDFIRNRTMVNISWAPRKVSGGPNREAGAERSELERSELERSELETIYAARARSAASIIGP